MADRERTTGGGPSAEESRIYRAAIAAFDRRDFEAAARQLESIRFKPGLAAVLARYYLGQAHFEIGRAKLAERRFTEAAARFEQARTCNPQTLRLLDYLALALSGDGRHAEAADALERAAAQGSGGDRTLESTRTIRLAHARWRAGATAQAMSLLREAMRRDPHAAEYPFQLGLLTAQSGAFEEAADLLRESTLLDPTHAAAHRHLGLACAAQRRMNDAAAALCDAVRLRPGDATTAREYSLALASCTPQIAAEFAAKSPPQSSPNSQDAAPGSNRRLAEAFEREPELIGAFLDIPTSAWDRDVLNAVSLAAGVAAERRPGYADLHLHRSRLLARTGRVDEALAAVDSAVSINPEYVAARIHRADLLATTERLNEAINELDRALDDGGDFADVHFRLAEMHRRSGHLEAAREFYLRALRLNADYADARAALAALPAA